MRSSEKLDLLATALVAVQSALTPAVKDNKANYGTYADLSSVWEACRKPLTDNGLSVTQGLGQNTGDGFVWTMLLHKSGQWIVGECPLILGKRDPQGVGAAVTYYRRYGLAAILGITQEDDDAQSAMPGGKVKAAPDPAQQKAMEGTADKAPSGAFKFHKKAMEGTVDMPSLAAAFGRAKAERERMSKVEFDALTVLKDARKSELNEGRRAA